MSITENRGDWKRRIPIELYTSDEHFAAEQQRLFRRTWLNVGRADELTRDGSYFTVALDVVGANIVVTRDADGQHHAFHNVCSHRGAPVCPEGSGTARGFVCPFHSWRFGLDGSCRNVTDAEGYGPLDMDELALTPLAIDSWAGFLFVHMDPSPAQTLREFLGPIADKLDDYPFDELGGSHYRFEIPLDANWKTVRDSFVESHHTRHLHSKTLAPVFVTPDNPFSHGIDHEAKGPHGTFSLVANPDFAPSAFEMVAMLRGTPEALMVDEDPPGVNEPQAEGWMMDINVIFPNFFIDPFKTSYLTYNFWPVAVDQMVWRIDLYFPKAANASERVMHESQIVRARDALLEDIKVIEDINNGFRSGARSETVLHDEEFLIAHGHAAAEAVMGDVR